MTAPKLSKKGPQRPKKLSKGSQSTRQIAKTQATIAEQIADGRYNIAREHKRFIAEGESVWASRGIEPTQNQRLMLDRAARLSIALDTIDPVVDLDQFNRTTNLLRTLMNDLALLAPDAPPKPVKGEVVKTPENEIRDVARAVAAHMGIGGPETDDSTYYTSDPDLKNKIPENLDTRSTTPDPATHATNEPPTHDNGDPVYNPSLEPEALLSALAANKPLPQIAKPTPPKNQNPPEKSERFTPPVDPLLAEQEEHTAQWPDTIKLDDCLSYIATAEPVSNYNDPPRYRLWNNAGEQIAIVQGLKVHDALEQLQTTGRYSRT